MGWGLELWDKENEVKAQVEDGIKFVERSRTFVSEVVKLEQAFGAQLKKLVKQFMPASPDDAYTQDSAFRVRYLTFVDIYFLWWLFFWWFYLPFTVRLTPQPLLRLVPAWHVDFSHCYAHVSSWPTNMSKWLLR
jgi:hypothetical protein